MASFREKVYKVVKKIPKGKTLTYKEVAELAGKPRAFRAAGNALNKNCNPKIPCHRIIRSDGKTGGYKDGTKKKIELLKKENCIIIKDILYRKGVGETLRFPRIGKQAFAERRKC